MSKVQSLPSNVLDMPDDVVLRVDNVSKKFCKNLKRSMKYGIKDLAGGLFGIRDTGYEMRDTGGGYSNHESRISNQPTDDGLRPAEFWAVKDVSFDLKRGECLGLIGRNGCGKTTLLRLLAGIFPPDRGSISVRGRVGALISLGAGFHPHMTGRENIYLNGSILGLSKKEIAAQFDDIVDFAEIGEFIDAPVSTYSSGMRVRLGFAVATAIKPDLLLIDEVLAVGDASFRAKCYNSIGRLLTNSAAIFVSHQAQQVSQICGKALYLFKGNVAFHGAVQDGILRYSKELLPESQDLQGVTVVDYPVAAATLSPTHQTIKYGDNFNINAEIDLKESMEQVCLRVPFYNQEGAVIAEWHSKNRGVVLNLKEGKNKLSIVIGPILFTDGKYKIGFVLNDKTGVYLPYWSLKNASVEVSNCRVGSSEYQLKHVSVDLKGEKIFS